MRIPCLLILLLAGTLTAHAQAVKPDSVVASAHGAITPEEKLRPIETVVTVPDRIDTKPLVQLLPYPFSISNAQLVTLEWSDVPGWTTDDHTAAFAAFLASCKIIVRGTPPQHLSRPFYTALQSVCRRAVNEQPHDLAAARIFFEKNFRPMRIAPLGEADGFLTGYYEPVIEGSRVRNAEFNVPLYRAPSGLTKPYYDRAAIEDGALAGRKLEICWLKDPTDAFFAQIQGSARVKLVEDGTVLRLNYSAHNGWPYTAIGGILIHRNIVPREEMSMDRIREWIEENPKEGKELRRRNKSFVFFRETSLPEHLEPVGAQGVSLTPGRSIAVDRNIHIYGTPFFIEAALPFDSENSENSFQRLMVAQDTGGAIIGPARADLYFGAGSGAAHVAGRIRHPGHFTILIPREIDPVVAGRSTPLPRPRPVFAGEEKLAVAAEKPAPVATKEAITGH